MRFNRRHFLQLTGLSALSSHLQLLPARAEDKVFSHAISLYGDIKYPADFKHFDYVNPTAPKGGRVRIGIEGSFDNLNSYTYKGDPAAIVFTGIPTAPVTVSNYESLTIASLEEPGTSYGLLAESVWYPEDRSQVVYRLRPEARFHDGRPITVEDVIWSFDALRQNRPDMEAYYRNVAKAEQTGDHEITFIISTKNNRELPYIVGQIPALPKHWWTGKDETGKDRDISKTTLEIPLGSGPYKCVEVNPGSSILLRRVPDYWGKDLPVRVGQDNFDEISVLYFRDGNVEFEAFKGDQYDFRDENSAKNWATGYDIPAVRDKKIIKEEVIFKVPRGMQSYTLNLRREKFADVRLRQALNFAFDFEWTNANLFYDQYKRSRSYFNNSEMEATGLPSEAELALLTPLKDQIPPEVFTTAYTNPVNGNQQERRKNLREAMRLLGEAGWSLSQDNGKSVLKNAVGQPLEIEFLLNSPLLERITLPYQQQLALIGITATVRTVDPAQFKRRIDDYDFDVIVGVLPMSDSPGNELRSYWGAANADVKGGVNYSGIKNPAVDSLIETVITAKSREDLDTACKALDRVLMWNHYVVPMYYGPKTRLAYWDRFGKPATMPEFGLSFPNSWWWDEEKASRIKAG